MPLQCPWPEMCMWKKAHGWCPMSSNPNWARGQYNCPHPTNNSTYHFHTYSFCTESYPSHWFSPIYIHMFPSEVKHIRDLWYLAHKCFVNVLSSERQLSAWIVLLWLDYDLHFMLLEVGRIRGLKSTTCTPDTNASITAKRTEKNTLCD